LVKKEVPPQQLACEKGLSCGTAMHTALLFATKEMKCTAMSGGSPTSLAPSLCN